MNSIIGVQLWSAYPKLTAKTMISRLLQLPDDESFFLFGPRGAGKTTWLKNQCWFKDALYINLLLASEESRFTKNPDELIDIVHGLPEMISHVIIDEVQKIPKLLDIVHELIETTSIHFVLTGSSARKLKYGGANLLAGRAFVYHLHPFVFSEITNQFDLMDSLQWGMLPKIKEYATIEKKKRYLYAYTTTYLKEEIWAEQFIKKLDPFRYFLEVAAQSNGKLINFSNIAKDVGCDIKTIQNYFTLLEDTLLGFFLPAFQHSFRKRLSKTPKFYFFDPGVVRALSGLLSLPLKESTSHYGEVFEHFIILQCKFLASYFYPDYKFSYLKTKDDAEIDLVVERPGRPLLFIEIKSTAHIQEHHLSNLKALSQDIEDCEAVCFSRDPYAKKIDNIRMLPWAEGIETYFSQR